MPQHADHVSDTPVTRRAAIAGLGVAGLGALAAGAVSPAALAQPAQRRTPAGANGLDLATLGFDAASGQYRLPKLPYAYDALEPHIDAATMEIHHSKHHQGYVNGLNKALAELKKIREGSADAGLVKHWSRELAFHGGGHVNHTLFWSILRPSNSESSTEPTGELARAIRDSFGSFDAFKKHFTAAADAVEGSGWAWLMYEPMSRSLIATQMEKQQNVYLTGARPVLGVDVWEHAYYLKYQNRRGDYTKAFWSVVNWEAADALYAAARA